MKISVQSSKAVKPVYGGGGGSPPVGADVVPLTVLDTVNLDEYLSTVFFFRPPAPPSSVLETGFGKVLAEYREWAGSLGTDAGGNRVILLNDAGARFVEATADVALDRSVMMPFRTEVRSGLHLHPSGRGADVEELMLVQVTRFTCGSYVVGCTMHRVVGDGRAHCNIITAWGQMVTAAAARGGCVGATNIAPVPVHDRRSLFAPRNPPRVEFEHRGVEFNKKKKQVTKLADKDEVVVQPVHLSREMIAALKSQASAPFSTLECVVAHLWRCITRARSCRLDDETGSGAATYTSLRIAVDGRGCLRMRGGLPVGYCGNAVLWAWPTTTARQLLCSPLGHAAGLVCGAVAGIDDAYFQSFVDFASSGSVQREGLVPSTAGADPSSAAIEVHSMLGMPFYDLDFGGGPPFYVINTGYAKREGVVFIMPSCSGGDDGSIHAHVSLFRRHVAIFNNCCYALLGPIAARL